MGHSGKPGWTLAVTDGAEVRQMEGKFNNAASSAIVKPNCILQLFDNASFQGKSIVLAASASSEQVYEWPAFPDVFDFNDKASSYICRCRDFGRFARFGRSAHQPFAPDDF